MVVSSPINGERNFTTSKSLFDMTVRGAELVVCGARARSGFPDSRHEPYEGGGRWEGRPDKSEWDGMGRAWKLHPMVGGESRRGEPKPSCEKSGGDFDSPVVERLNKQLVDGCGICLLRDCDRSMDA
eukprot:6368811-Pyramimonas_sp.AAC.1